VFRDADVLDGAHRLRAEFCVLVSGVVEIRPEGNVNPDIATGEIEINATSLTVLGESAPLPFQLDELAGEEARLRHRYLDMRRAGGPGDALRLRSRVNAAARSVLASRDFIEIETPTLTRSTPEGARDFLVPAACSPARFTRCRRARSCSSSCSWSAVWSVTTRSRGATATRTSAPTASLSSPNSTSK
jgi:aspartyl-tRNA synthetase